MKTLQQLPFYFRIAKEMILRDIPGGWRLMSTFNRLGLLDKSVWVPFFDDSKLLTPLSWSWYWLHKELSEYEPSTLKLFTQIINDEKSCESIFFDCGGHIGLISHYVSQQCSLVKNIVIFEPNSELHTILRENADSLPTKAEVVAKALSNYEGNATLVLDPDNEDGAFIIPDSLGDISTTKIDNLNFPKNKGLIMKIDVEGSELAILQGAKIALSNAPFFIVMFEAHKDVMNRTGIDPMECVKFLNDIRSVEWMPTGPPDVRLDLDLPFFEQMPQYTKRDIIVHTTT